MDNQSQNPIQFTPQLSNKAKKALSRLRKAQECLKDAPILDEIQAMTLFYKKGTFFYKQGTNGQARDYGAPPPRK